MLSSTPGRCVSHSLQFSTPDSRPVLSFTLQGKLYWLVKLTHTDALRDAANLKQSLMSTWQRLAESWQTLQLLLSRGKIRETNFTCGLFSIFSFSCVSAGSLFLATSSHSVRLPATYILASVCTLFPLRSKLQFLLLLFFLLLIINCHTFLKKKKPCKNYMILFEIVQFRGC